MGDLHRPPGQGRDFAPGFDPANYFTVGGSFATQNVMLDPGLKSPLTKEFTVSAGGTLGDRGHFKGTYIRRRAGNFIENFIDTTTGVTEIMRDGRSFGTFDNELFRNTDLLQRNYDALQFDGRYSVTSRFQLDGSYTVQIRNEGNFEGENTNQPGVASVAFNYPEIYAADRHYPFGRLNDFQRHKVRIWGIYNLGLGPAGDVDLAGIWRYTRDRPSASRQAPYRSAPSRRRSWPGSPTPARRLHSRCTSTSAAPRTSRATACSTCPCSTRSRSGARRSRTSSSSCSTCSTPTR